MKRNKHSLSHYRLLSADMGTLVPIGWFEVLPGDTLQHATSALVRAAPLVSPVMHPVEVRIHHWYVPTRLIWSEFEDFITGGPTGYSVPVPPVRTMANPGSAIGSLDDYLGIPTGAIWNSAQYASVLPHRAYATIWNENYRDQDLQAALVVSEASGIDVTTSTALQNVSWEKDYFTSSRPWEQKGPTVTVPLGSSATVRTSASNLVTGAQAAMNLRLATTGAANPAGFSLASGTNGGPANSATVLSPGVETYPGNLYADLSNATAASINQLRQAFAIQRFEEARARYGSRYTEYLRHLGVRSSDARLQRPEYLGGGKQTIQFSEVLQTNATGTITEQNAVGALKGHGIGAMRSNRYRRFIEEHGIVMSLMSVRPKTMYMDGLERKFSRTTKEDYWQRELEHIGQQPVKNSEVYAAHLTPAGTFGYQDRYDEYRRVESGVSGEFRTTLNYWHMARSFGSTPALNASFVSSVPTLRNFASSTTDPLYVMAKHSIQARRMVAKSGKSFIF